MRRRSGVLGLLGDWRLRRRCGQSHWWGSRGSSGAQVGAGAENQAAAVRRQRWEQSIQAAQQRELDYIVEARDFFGSAEQAAPSADDAPAAGQLDGALERRVKTFGVPSPRAPLSIAVADRSPRSAATPGAGPAREWCSAALQCPSAAYTPELRAWCALRLRPTGPPLVRPPGFRP